MRFFHGQTSLTITYELHFWFSFFFYYVFVEKSRRGEKSPEGKKKKRRNGEKKKQTIKRMIGMLPLYFLLSYVSTVLF